MTYWLMYLSELLETDAGMRHGCSSVACFSGIVNVLMEAA